MRGTLTNWFRKLAGVEPQGETCGSVSLAMPDADADRALLSLVDLTTEQHNSLHMALCALQNGGLPNAFDMGRADLLPSGEGYVYGPYGASARNGRLAEVIVAYHEAGGKMSLSGDGTPTDPRVLLDTVHLSARIAPGLVDSRVLALGLALRTAGADPRMRAALELIDRRSRWGETHALCMELQLRRPLSWLFVCELAAEGRQVEAARARRRIAQLQRALPGDLVPPSEEGPERAWVAAMLEVRVRMLSASTHPDAPRLLQRTAAVGDLIRARSWDLRRPFDLLGVRIP